MWAFLITIQLLFLLIFIGSGIKVLKEWERVALFRLGKFHSIRGPGIIWKTPILDKLSPRISLKAQQVTIDTGELRSVDGASVRIVGEIIYRVADIEKVILAIENHKEVAEKASHHAVVESMESMAYDDIVTSRNEVEDRVKGAGIQTSNMGDESGECRSTSPEVKLVNQLDFFSCHPFAA